MGVVRRSAEHVDGRHEYLSQPGFSRLWPLVRKKYESYGRAAGAIRLTNLTDEERQALEGLLAINLWGRSAIKISLSQLEEALQNTRFHLSLTDCFDLLYGDEWATREKREERERRAWERFCSWAMRGAKQEQVRRWVKRLIEGNGLGYRTFLQCFHGFAEQGTCHEWIIALRALESLPAKGELLPVFSARTTGDPHGLDRSTLAGRMFYWGMVELFSPEEAEKMDELADEENSMEALAPSEQRRRQYEKAGLFLDDVSSVVWVTGWKGFHEEAVAVPLLTLVGREKVNLPGVPHLYVVENPSIFSAFIDHWQRKGKSLPFPLVCTSGQPSLAALCLLDRTEKDGTQIYYSGDFDVKGLEIAIGLRQRYGERWHPWHMDGEVYRLVDHPHLPAFSEGEKNLLARLRVVWDSNLPAIMREKGKKVFQEHILPQLLQDWE